MAKIRSRKLSELEGVCLGLVHRNGPCTAYYVRLKLKQAPSSHWQASAGSVYPLLARLEADGLVDTTVDSADGRGRKLLGITSRGKTAVKKWLLAGADRDTISAVTDPIRSRTFFLGLLSAPQRSKYLDEIIAETQKYCGETQDRLDEESEDDDLFGYLGCLGALKITEARLEWLLNVQRRLSAKS